MQQIDMGDGDWIRIPARLSYGFVSQFGDMKGAGEGAEKVIGFLAKLVREWNFALKDGTPAPVTEDNIRRLDIATINAMVAAITPLMTVEKKDSVA